MGDGSLWESLWSSHSVVSDSFVAPWTVACQAPLSVGFFRQEYWSGLPFPSPGGLPNPGIKPMAPATPLALQKDSLLLSRWSLGRNECCASITIKSVYDSQESGNFLISTIKQWSSGEMLMDDNNHLCN